MMRLLPVALAIAMTVAGCTTAPPPSEAPTSPAQPSPSSPADTAAPTTAPPTTAPTTTSSATPPATVERWIGVRLVDGQGEFYDTRTGSRFVPRGMNYNRFLPATSHPGLSDNLFTTRYYDPATVDADLAEMASLGYNSVRVMIETCDPGDGCIASGPGSDRLNLDYIDNVVDFLRRARDQGLVVMIASNTLPDDSYWLHATANLQDEQFQSANNEFLNPRAVPLYVDYWTKVVAALVERGARNVGWTRRGSIARDKP